MCIRDRGCTRWAWMRHRSWALWMSRTMGRRASSSTTRIFLAANRERYCWKKMLPGILYQEARKGEYLPSREWIWNLPWTRTYRYASVSYTHLRAHETRHDLVCRLLLEKKKKKKKKKKNTNKKENKKNKKKKTKTQT